MQPGSVILRILRIDIHRANGIKGRVKGFEGCSAAPSSHVLEPRAATPRGLPLSRVPEKVSRHDCLSRALSADHPIQDSGDGMGCNLDGDGSIYRGIDNGYTCS